jgi:hypothetical protein
MSKNRFLDDDVEVISSDTGEIIPQNIIETNPIIEPIDNTLIDPVIQPVIQQINEEDNYMKTIKEYEEQEIAYHLKEGLLDLPIEPVKIHMFRSVKDLTTGDINIEPKNLVKVLQSEEPKQTTDGLQDCIIEMLEKTNKDLLKAIVEVKINVELCNMEISGDKRKTYEQQLVILRNNVIYQQNRKNILERML